MKNIIKALSVIAVLAAMSAPALAADKDERADKVVFDRLVREMRQTHQKYRSAYQRAVAEARDNGGKASMEIKAAILALRDEVDRKTTRVTLIALRHGWEVPRLDLGKPGVVKPTASRKELIFSSVDDLIRTAFAREARQLAAKVHLPVVSVKSAKSPESKKSGLQLLNPLS